jgi:hypothetical protein
MGSVVAAIYTYCLSCPCTLATGGLSKLPDMDPPSLHYACQCDIHLQLSRLSLFHEYQASFCSSRDPARRSKAETLIDTINNSSDGTTVIYELQQGKF